MIRLVYSIGCLVLAGFAGFLYYEQTQQTAVVTATHDLSIGSLITDQDVALHRIASGSVPSGALSQVDQAIGQFVTFPLMSGQFVTSRHLSPSRTGAALANGLPVPPGDRILSLPVGPSSAVGGALAPGDLVDVIAVPDVTRAQPGSIVDPAGNTVLGERVLVLGLRTDQGTAADLDPRAASLSPTKVGSVLLAIPGADEQRYAAAIAVDTFVLTLVTG
ncbi:MAG TPA: Flp pilus assembly protein CpaB [Candidatus Limnocylindrales bacterium]|nr:Flp pilus assembly protein CpaB [Candidatus Limnocylindrales bacterium]